MLTVRVVGAAWIRDGRVLAARRGPGRARAGWWELPGGKVDPGETDEEALVRELREELGVDVVVGDRLGVSLHREAEAIVELVAYVVTGAGEPAPTEHDALRWLGRDELADVDWAPADVPLVVALRRVLTG